MAEPMTSADLRAFLRFCETSEDGEEYDVPRPRMERICRMGLVAHLGKWRFEETPAGSLVRQAADLLQPQIEPQENANG